MEPRRILVIDDEEAMLKFFERLLIKMEGMEVTVGKSGNKALDIFQPGQFEMAFIDINLGQGPDGIEVAEGIRRRDSKIEIIMMSGDMENDARVKKAGLGKLLIKPFGLEEIRQLIGR